MFFHLLESSPPMNNSLILQVSYKGIPQNNIEQPKWLLPSFLFAFEHRRSVFKLNILVSHVVTTSWGKYLRGEEALKINAIPLRKESVKIVFKLYFYYPDEPRDSLRGNLLNVNIFNELWRWGEKTDLHSEPPKFNWI